MPHCAGPSLPTGGLVTVLPVCVALWIAQHTCHDAATMRPCAVRSARRLCATTICCKLLQVTRIAEVRARMLGVSRIPQRGLRHAYMLLCSAVWPGGDLPATIPAPLPPQTCRWNGLGPDHGGERNMAIKSLQPTLAPSLDSSSNTCSTPRTRHTHMHSRATACHAQAFQRWGLVCCRRPIHTVAGAPAHNFQLAASHVPLTGTPQAEWGRGPANPPLRNPPPVPCGAVLACVASAPRPPPLVQPLARRHGTRLERLPC